MDPKVSENLWVVVLFKRNELNKVLSSTHKIIRNLINWKEYRKVPFAFHYLKKKV